MITANHLINNNWDVKISGRFLRENLRSLSSPFIIIVKLIPPSSQTVFMGKSIRVGRFNTLNYHVNLAFKKALIKTGIIKK